ncbi:tRNA dihydrouridine synthase DusB [Solitalea lacus]|uniref:tRNA dihydrouridine synthase DusB n=1 Tax=Solitalea lacus TaxID=2911172 RepID=UPI001EDB1CF4|nr:tRNA dihydrouridine synthase DusB [Solitalea lacus]
MEDVSDPPFRYVCKQNGADLMYTEFISSEGLIRDAAKSIQKLDIFEYERPIGIQIFGSNIDSMREATVVATKAEPNLIDINYGCPVKNVACKGAGASLLQDIDKMVKMTKAVVEATHLPVTVKTRLGWDDNTKNVYEVAERLQEVGIKALTIHGRTRSQMYKGVADWTLIREIKRNPNIEIPIFGNGDVDSVEKAFAWRKEFEVDGIMIGRASIGYPWIFREVKHFFETGEILTGPTIAERVEVCRTHFMKSIEWKGEKVGIFEMRRHYANYFKGLQNSKELRNKLVSLNSVDEINAVLDEINSVYSEVLA